jgi:hypothetical protein
MCREEWTFSCICPWVWCWYDLKRCYAGPLKPHARQLNRPKENKSPQKRSKAIRSSWTTKQTPSFMNVAREVAKGAIKNPVTGMFIRSLIFSWRMYPCIRSTPSPRSFSYLTWRIQCRFNFARPRRLLTTTTDHGLGGNYRDVIPAWLRQEAKQGARATATSARLERSIYNRRYTCRHQTRFYGSISSDKMINSSTQGAQRPCKGGASYAWPHTRLLLHRASGALPCRSGARLQYAR